MINELIDIPSKISSFKIIAGNVIENENLITQAHIQSNKIIHDAVSALENIGFQKGKCYPIVHDEFSKNKNIDLEELIRISLIKLNSSV